MTELFNLVGAVAITAVTVNYSSVATRWLGPWLRLDPTVADGLIFWLFFLSLLFGWRVLLRYLASLMKWERLHWAIQGIGLILGGLRGLWWSGFILIALSTSGFTYLRESVEQQSVVGPRLTAISRLSLEQVTDRFPGVASRRAVLIPPMKPTKPTKPAADEPPAERPTRLATTRRRT